MIPPDDNEPKGPANDTIPASAPSGDLVPAIPAGQAEAAMTRALHDLAGAYLRVEGLALACARGLDATAK